MQLPVDLMLFSRGLGMMMCGFFCFWRFELPLVLHPFSWMLPKTGPPAQEIKQENRLKNMTVLFYVRVMASGSVPLLSSCPIPFLQRALDNDVQLLVCTLVCVLEGR